MTQWLGLLATTKTTVFNLHEGCVANDKSKINGFRHLGFWKNVNNAGLDRYLHQILRDNALDIGLYNSLYYCTSCDHGLYKLFSQSEVRRFGDLCIIQFDEWFQSVLVSFSIKSEPFSREVSLTMRSMKYLVTISNFSHMTRYQEIQPNHCKSILLFKVFLPKSGKIRQLGILLLSVSCLLCTINEHSIM